MACYVLCSTSYSCLNRLRYNYGLTDNGHFLLFTSVTKSTFSSAKSSLGLASVPKIQNVNWCTGQESLQSVNESPPKRRTLRRYPNWILLTMKVSCRL